MKVEIDTTTEMCVAQIRESIEDKYKTLILLFSMLDVLGLRSFAEISIVNEKGEEILHVDRGT